MNPARIVGALALILASAVTLGATPRTTGADAASPPVGAREPVSPVGSAAPVAPVRHIFVINLENKGYAETFGNGSRAPYLSKKLRHKGQLLKQYYGVAHRSLPNYIAQISGQGPNAQTQANCKVYSNFTRSGSAAPGQAVGQGCVYPKTRAHGCQSTNQARTQVEGLHAEHGQAMPPPQAEHQGPNTEGGDRRPVRREAQPVCLLPLDHRLAEVQEEERGSEGAAPGPGQDSHDGEPHLHHAQPVQRRARQPVRRRPERWPRHCEQVAASLGAQDPRVTGIQEERAARRDLRRGRQQGRQQRGCLLRGRSRPEQPAAWHHRPRAAVAPARCWSRRSSSPGRSTPPRTTTIHCSAPSRTCSDWRRWAMRWTRAGSVATSSAGRSASVD